MFLQRINKPTRLMKRTRLLFGLCCLLAICSLPLKAQDNRNMYLRWGIMAGLNGYNAHTLNLSDDRGRYGFNLAARAELSFTDAPSRMYLDAELGLLKLGWKDGQAGYAIDALRFPGHGTMAPSAYSHPYWDVYSLHLPIHIGYRWAVARGLAIYADAGPYVSFGLSGKLKYTDPVTGTKLSENVFHVMRRFDWGLGVRLGAEIANHLRIGAAYDFGLMNNMRGGMGSGNNNLTVSVGYMF